MVPSSSWYHQHICMVHTNNLRRKCCVVMLGNNKKIYLRKCLHHLITADEALINFFLSPKQKFSLKCEENQEKNYWWTQKCLNRWVKLWSSLFETEKKKIILLNYLSNWLTINAKYYNDLHIGFFYFIRGTNCTSSEQ